jgi:Fic family protein
MSLAKKLQQIDKLQEQIVAYGKLADDVLKKINYKLRLEWNYTSNSMEGNSLTKSETRSVMIGNITVNAKPIKDILEVKGHDEVISAIMKMGKGELNISEKRIKEIHIGIMHEEDQEKKKMIGQWKKDNNYLYNYKNERFDFVAPADVPERMHQLVNWINNEKDKITRKQQDALHPVMLALRFNLEYVTIHPFYDGNGRTSRILTNLILISYGYPPLYIKENERAAYYQYLADIQGYGGEPDIFYEYMTELIIRSQEIIVDAIEGREITE